MQMTYFEIVVQLILNAIFEWQLSISNYTI